MEAAQSVLNNLNNRYQLMMKKMKSTTDYLKNVNDYQESNYRCNKCRDMMFIIQEDGTAKACECRIY